MQHGIETGALAAALVSAIHAKLPLGRVVAKDDNALRQGLNLAELVDHGCSCPTEVANLAIAMPKPNAPPVPLILHQLPLGFFIQLPRECCSIFLS